MQIISIAFRLHGTVGVRYIDGTVKCSAAGSTELHLSSWSSVHSTVYLQYMYRIPYAVCSDLALTPQRPRRSDDQVCPQLHRVTMRAISGGRDIGALRVLWVLRLLWVPLSMLVLLMLVLLVCVVGSIDGFGNAVIAEFINCASVVQRFWWCC